MNEYIYLS